MLKLDEVTNAYRLVHSEGDGLSGLVVDRFGDTLVLEFFAAGMYQPAHRDHGRAASPLPRRAVLLVRGGARRQAGVVRLPLARAAAAGRHHRARPEVPRRAGKQAQDRLLRRPARQPHGAQRVLRAASACSTSAATPAASGSTPRRSGGAEEVVGLDLDEQALELAKQNAKLNGAQIRYVQADLFAWLRDMIPNGERFDVVVLDPAKLTRDREIGRSGARKYCDMNRLALQVVAPGGVFLTCSCTGLVSEADFLESLRRAGVAGGADAAGLQGHGAGADHPFLLHVPEGRYLKAVFCRVE